METPSGTEDFPLPDRDDAHRAVVETFAAQVLDGSAKPYVSRDFGRSVIRECEAALLSAEEGRRVGL